MTQNYRLETKKLRIIYSIDDFNFIIKLIIYKKFTRTSYYRNLPLIALLISKKEKFIAQFALVSYKETGVIYLESIFTTIIFFFNSIAF